MSTRRLILTALVCGLAILVAGGVQLFRVAGTDPVELPVLGESRTLGGVTVSVVAADLADDLNVITVELRAVDDTAVGADAATGWTMLQGTGRPTGPIGGPAADGSSSTPSCSTIRLTTTSQRCTLGFAGGTGDRYVSYSRSDVLAQWAIDADG